MIFQAIVSYSVNGIEFELPYKSSTLDDIIGFYQSELTALEGQRSLLNNLPNLDLNSQAGKAKVLEYLEYKLGMTVSVRDTEINFHLVKGVNTKQTLRSIEPNLVENTAGFYSVSSGLTLSNTIFRVPLVDLQCSSGNLHIENVDFGDAKVIINGRELTKEEVNHISSLNVRDAHCPIGDMEITIEVRDQFIPQLEELKDFIYGADGADLSQEVLNLRQEVLKELASVSERVTKLADTLTKLNLIRLQCSEDQFKTIDTTCAGIEDFDFMSV